ncbi:MAG: hypothetical protein WC814_01870 [Candidatus Paceibacterota bacterium]|jgi:hypothetical protein
MPKFFSGRVGTARLFFFSGLALVIIAMVVGIMGYHHFIQHESYVTAVLAASFLAPIGLVAMIAGSIQIWEIVQGGNNTDGDFH